VTREGLNKKLRRPVVYESSIIWSGDDFVNGVRKINLLFNLIEQAQYIFI